MKQELKLLLQNYQSLNLNWITVKPKTITNKIQANALA